MKLEVIVFSLLAAFFASAITFLVTKKAVTANQKSALALDYEVKKSALIQEASGAVLQSDHYKDKLDLEYKRGFSDGQKAELDKFLITYEPFDRTVEEYLGIKKRVEIGYSSSIFYSGFKIAGPAREVTHENVEYNQERIEKILNSEVAGSINALAQFALSKGVNSKMLPRKSTKGT